MTRLPLPPGLHEHVALQGGTNARTNARTNRSLVFDRGVDFYALGWGSPAPGDKQKFLERFRRKFSQPEDFAPFLERRRRALELAGARSKPLYSQTRLVLGLGLPHPTETALLFDRLTGCPYIPGSSVKGLLRQAAQLVAAGELETADNHGDGRFWAEDGGAHLDRLFGPPADSKLKTRGELVVYDAFPDDWPSLALDVLTPHYGDYYGDDPDAPEKPPADWHDPVPVAFLTVRPGTPFTFWLGLRGRRTTDDERPEDLERVQRLLVTALDWLGIGGKTSSGYGLFGEKKPDPAEKEDRPRKKKQPGDDGEPPPPPPPPPPDPKPAIQEVLWKNVTLEFFERKPTIFKDKKGKQKAQTLKEDLPPKLLKRLKKKKELRVNAWVMPRDREWRIEDVEEVKE